MTVETPSPFETYQLPEPLMRALQAMNYSEPTPIQAQAIPLAMAGDDIIGCAQTGTGKTAAFLIPTIAKMFDDIESQTLILVPTRELADQVFQVIRSLTQFIPHMRTVLLMGGAPISKQFRLLRQPYKFLVATPGRLNDHLKRGSVELDHVKHLVIDEADRLLDMGFAPQLATILNFLPDKRQSSMFTATLGENVRKLSSKYLTEPKTIRLANTNEFKKSIQQRNVIVAKNSDKQRALLDELKKAESSALVFARTQINVDRVARFLQESGIEAAQIHGGRTQGQRMWALRGFQKGEHRVLVATDIASRGLDINHVGLVVNYEMPEDPDDYVHRIGRTGRADKEGLAVNILTKEDETQWKRINMRVRGGFEGGPQYREKEKPRNAPPPARSTPYEKRNGSGAGGAKFHKGKKDERPSRDDRASRFAKPPRPPRIKGDRPTASNNPTRPAATPKSARESRRPSGRGQRNYSPENPLNSARSYRKKTAIKN
jgi:superfamily II DNA/RNA helicase